MGNAEIVQVVQRDGDLMRELPCTIFRQPEPPLLKVGEEVAAGEEFHHDENVILVLENVFKLDDVRMLANFEDFNLALKHLLIFQRQIFFLDDLDGNFFACLLMDSFLYKSVFALA